MCECVRVFAWHVRAWCVCVCGISKYHPVTLSLIHCRRRKVRVQRKDVEVSLTEVKGMTQRPFWYYIVIHELCFITG